MSLKLANCLSGALWLGLAGCVTQHLEVVSHPKGAQVLIYNSDLNVYEKVGVTPFLIDEDKLMPSLIFSSDHRLIQVSKRGFVPEHFFIDTSKGQTSQITVKLRPVKRWGSQTEANSHLAESLVKGLQSAYSMISQKQFEQALSKIDGLIKDFPGSYSLLNLKGSLYVLSKRREAAIESYQRSLEIFPNGIEAKEMLERLR